MGNKKDVRAVVEGEFKEFVEEVQALNSVDLNNRLAQMAKHAEEVINTKENDERLNEVREELKQLNAPYRDSLKALKLKNKYIILLLKDRGEI